MANQSAVVDGEFSEVPEAPEEPVRALTVAPGGRDTSLSINVEALVGRRKEFHEFMQRVLKQDVHFGIPKDKDGKPIKSFAKPFLWQAGAEEIFSAFECRPRYTSVFQTLDRESGEVTMIRKCEAVSMMTGKVMGEAEGTAASDEFAVNCRESVWAESGRHDGTIICPEHGKGRAKVWNNRSGDKLQCMGKTPEPFHKLLHNCLMRANKRAFVACARTLGCASEFFTQDEDMVIGERFTEAETRDRDEMPDTSSPADTRGAPTAETSVGDKWQTPDGGWRIHCAKHGPSKGREWDRGASIACTRRDGDNWCDFKVRADGGNEYQQQPTGRTNDDIRGAHKYVVDFGVEPDDLKEFMAGEGYKFGPRQNVTLSTIKQYCMEKSCAASEWANRVVAWFNAKYPPAKPQAQPEPPFREEEGEAREPTPQEPRPKPVNGSMLLEAAVGPPRAAVNCPIELRDSEEICHVYSAETERHCHKAVEQFSEWGKPLCAGHAAEWARDGAKLKATKEFPDD